MQADEASAGETGVKPTVSGSNQLLFPFDVFDRRGFPGEVGELVDEVRPISMFPPHPWGQCLYGRLLVSRCGRLPGDIIETGVGRGGTSIFLASVVKKFRLAKRVLSVDTFEGLPPTQTRQDNRYFAEGDYRLKKTSDPEEGFQRFWVTAHAFGVGDLVEPLAGLFEEVLPGLDPEQRFCFVHVDADLYDSVGSALAHLWDRVEEGGVVAIDDFFHPSQGPLRATCEFFNDRGLFPLFHVVFPYGVFVIKGEDGRWSRSVDGNAYSLDEFRNDAFLAETLEASMRRSETDDRATHNCALLLELMRAPAPSKADIYDYWRALEQFWERIDVLPSERSQL